MKLSLLFLLLTAISAPAKPSAPNYIQDGKQVVSNLAAGHFGAVEKIFTPQMAQGLPAEKLREVWSQLNAQAGPFQKIEKASLTMVQGYHVVLVTCRFAKTDLVARVVLDSKEKVAGLFFVPATATTSWSAPSYAQPSKFREHAITVVYKRWRLPGTVTRPNGQGPFPGVVLVPGSGPNDEDESIGPNKPFKDLAWGLASRGIVVLRYTKRTRQYGAAFAPRPDFTVNDTTVNDARAAVALLAAQPEIEHHKVFVLGHSLGGMMAPRIATDDPAVAGIIILAGPTQPYGATVVRQVKYIVSLEDPGTAKGKREIDRAEAFERAIESPALTPSEIVNDMGVRIPGSYFLDLRSYNPGATAAKLKMPILVLQGGKDYNVTRADFEGWKRALAGHANATFKFYPGLAHLFMPSASKGSALGTPADDFRPSHVDPAVINEIAAWIAQQAGTRNLTLSSRKQASTS